MKKISFLLLITLMFSLCFSACGVDSAITGDNYTLSSVTLDGAEIEHEAGSLVLGRNGRGTLTLGEDSCGISYDDSSVTLNSIKADTVFSDGAVVITMGDTGLVYTFTASGGGDSAGSEPEQAESSGSSCSGRLYFSSCTGDWAEYDGNSIAVEGTLTSGEDGRAELQLLAPAYSDTVPVFKASLITETDTVSVSDATAFHYMLQDGSVTAAKGTMPGSQLNNTEFIDPHEYDWYVEEEGEPEPDPEVEYISIEGGCRDDSGSFIFRILIKQD